MKPESRCLWHRIHADVTFKADGSQLVQLKHEVWKCSQCFNQRKRDGQKANFIPVEWGLAQLWMKFKGINTCSFPRKWNCHTEPQYPSLHRAHAPYMSSVSQEESLWLRLQLTADSWEAVKASALPIVLSTPHWPLSFQCCPCSASTSVALTMCVREGGRSLPPPPPKALERPTLKP